MGPERTVKPLTLRILALNFAAIHVSVFMSNFHFMLWLMIHMLDDIKCMFTLIYDSILDLEVVP